MDTWTLYIGNVTAVATLQSGQEKWNRMEWWLDYFVCIFLSDCVTIIMLISYCHKHIIARWMVWINSCSFEVYKIYSPFCRLCVSCKCVLHFHSWANSLLMSGMIHVYYTWSYWQMRCMKAKTWLVVLPRENVCFPPLFQWNIYCDYEPRLTEPCIDNW